MSDNDLTVTVTVSNQAGRQDIAQTTIFPDNMGSVQIDAGAPRNVIRVVAGALENIARGLRLTLAGETDDCLSDMTFDRYMRPVASPASRRAVAVFLASMFDETSTPDSGVTPQASYDKLGADERRALDGIAAGLLDVAREADL